MSIESHIALSDNFFIGEEKDLKFSIVDAAGAALDVSGYALKWVMGVEGQTPLITITSAKITFENDAGTNDRVVVEVDRSVTVDLKPGNPYKHALWRVDSELEQVLSFGDCYLRRHPDV